MSNGQGCRCGACCQSQCGCDVDWTPQEIYDLREKLAAADNQITETQKDADEWMALNQENFAALRRCWARMAELEAYLRKMNHCPDCHKYICWPQGQFGGYQTDEILCQCKPEAGS